MLADMYMIEESELPKLSDPRMETYAAELEREFRAFDKPRQMLTTEIWVNCDKAWHCIRDDMPYLPTMKLIDNGMLGSSDIRDALKQRRNRLLSTLLPADESYLEPAKLDDTDDEEQLRKVKQFLIYLAERAKARKNVSAFLDQWLIRGTSALAVGWETRFRVKRAKRGMVQGLKRLAEEAGITEDDGTPLNLDGKVRYSKQIYNGPKLFPVDMYRLWLDPKMELGIDSEPAYIYLTFKSLSDLKNARNPENPNEKLYDEKVLEDVQEWTYGEYYHDNPYACESTKLMGIDPNLEDMGKFVPVYIFWRQEREFEDGEVYVDKFFYVARSRNDRGWKIIRVQDNPSDNGAAPFYVSTCDQWLNLPYGTGLAEKSLTAWRAKNILEAIGLNTSVLQASPPMYYAGGVIKDDKKPKMMPGGFQEIVMRPNIGMDWIAPFPLNPNNVELSMQKERYYGEKILSQTGAGQAGLSGDPSKSLAKEQTATEVRANSMESSLDEQIYSNQLSADVIEPAFQKMYDDARQYYTDDQTFVSKMDGDVTTNVLSRAELDKDREIKIVGKRGVMDKANLLNNLIELMKIMANPAAMQALGPGAKMLMQDVLVRIVGALGQTVKPEYTAAPEQLLASDPQIQMTAVQQALQNPEMRMQIAETLIQSPEGQQYMMALIQHVQKTMQGPQMLTGGEPVQQAPPPPQGPQPAPGGPPQ